MIYVKETKERKVASSLTSRKIENYFPSNKRVSDSFLRQKIQEEALFPNYIFAKASPENIDKIMQVRHVINLVHWKDKPVVIPDEYILGIKRFSKKYQDITVERMEINPASGERVSRIIGESVIELKLPAIGYKLKVQNDEYEVDENLTILLRKNDTGVPRNLRVGKS